MKLYLSTYKIGNKTEILKQWISTNDNKVVVIANALDCFPAGLRKNQHIAADLDQLLQCGFDPVRLDLRNYFDNSMALTNLLATYRVFYVLGGNTFVLRAAMKLSGFDDYLNSIVHKTDFLYAGHSAGICVLANDLHPLALVDDPDLYPYDYRQTIYQGLGWLDYLPLPHYQSAHPESKLIDKTKEYCEQNHLSYQTLRDGEVIITEI